MVAEEIQNVLVAWTAVFSLVMLAVSLVAYGRVRHRRVLFVSLGFALFFGKAMLFTAYLLNADILDLFLTGSALLDAVIMALLSFSVLAK